MNSIFVTGAGGFIGRRLTSYFLHQGKKVTILLLPDEANLYHSDDNLKVIIGDLQYPENILEQAKGTNIDVLYHLAWLGVSTENKNNYFVQRKNIDFAFSAIKLALDLHCNRIISTGSISEYAYADCPVNGYQSPSPSDIYAATKIAVHTYLELLAKQNEIDFNWVLIPSIYGPGRLDNNIITYSITSLLSGETPEYTKLEQRWDFIFIDDLIKALFLIGENGKKFKTYVVGSGNARYLYDYVKIIRGVINPQADLKIGFLPYKTNRIDNAVCDITEVQKDTGFFPETSFEKGIQLTVDYFWKQMKKS